METINLFKNVSEKAQFVFDTLTELVQRGVTVQEIAEMVKTHDNTKKTSKTLLGMTYHFYQLQLKDLKFYLETKQNRNEEILFFKVYTSDHIVFTYRSFEDGVSLQDQIKAEHLPEMVKKLR